MLLFCHCLLIGLAVSVPLHYTPTEDATTRPSRRSDPRCVIRGNPDFYGLGIRIGIYLQWITSFLANHFLHEAIDSQLDTNTIFLLAMFVATVVATVQHTVQTAEIVVLMQLCFGFLFSILSVWGYRTGTRKSNGQKLERIRFPLLGAGFRLTLATCLCAYGFWFWYKGAVRHHRHSGCPDYAFIFAQVNTAGGARIFFQIQFAAFLISYGFLFIRQIALIISFYCFTAAWTGVVAAFTVIFDAKSEIDTSLEELKPGSEDIDNITPRKRSKRNSVGQLLYESSDLMTGWYRFFVYNVINWAKGAMRRQFADSELFRPVLTPALSNENVSQTVMTVTKQITKQTPKSFFGFLKQWICLFYAVSWKRSNSNVSAKSSTLQHLVFGLVLFLNFYIFVARTIFQYLCVLVLKKCPPIDKPPLIPLPNFPLPKDDQPRTHDKWLQKAVYLFNVLCILYSVCATELILFWNNFEGVYTISSTGQLIPFIIALVGLSRLLQEISVRGSAFFSTEVIMKLLDVGRPPAEEDNILFKDPFSEKAAERMPSVSESVHSLHNGFEAVFRIQPVKRRHSIDINRNDADVDASKNSLARIRDLPKATAYTTDSLSETTSFHLHNRADLEKLEQAYGIDGIDVYSLKDGRNVWIVRDFKRSIAEGIGNNVEAGQSCLASGPFPLTEDRDFAAFHSISDMQRPPQRNRLPITPVHFRKRFREAASHLWHLHHEHWDSIRPPTSASNRRPSAMFFSIPSFSPHCRPRTWAPSVDFSELRRGYHTKSLPLVLTGLSLALHDFCGSLHLPTCANYAQAFGRVVQEAQEIRRGRKSGDFNIGEQHDNISKKWRRTFNEEAWAEIKKELAQRGKGWVGGVEKERRGGGAKMAWMTWGPGFEDVDLMGWEEMRMRECEKSFYDKTD